MILAAKCIMESIVCILKLFIALYVILVPVGFFFFQHHSISFWFKERFQWLSDKSHRLCSSMLLLSSKKAATICQFDLVNKRVTERADSKRLLTISNILVPCYCGNLFIHFPNFRIIIWASIHLWDMDDDIYPQLTMSFLHVQQRERFTFGISR